MLFECPRFVEQRSSMWGVCGWDTTLDNIVNWMCTVVDEWNAVSATVSTIVLHLQRKWRADQQLVELAP